MNTAPHWTAAAACARRTDLPWTRDAADVTPWQAETMRVVCRACPVLLDCLAAVDELDVTGGWWAGADRDPHTPDAATTAATATATASGTGTLSISSPEMCWYPRRRAGRTFSQGAYVLERDTAGAWHLGGVTSVGGTSAWDATNTSGAGGDATSGAGAA